VWPTGSSPPPADVFAHLAEVARCPVVSECLTAEQAEHPCARVVLWQWREHSLNQRLRNWRRFHQLPEPWVGRLERARILFVSSNPSIGGSVPEDPDDAPDKPHLVTDQWSDEAIVERQENAFSHYMEDGTRANGAGVTSYWAWTKARALEVLPGARPGEDYAITEVVRCKSKDERGVSAARAYCSDRHLRRTLELSPADLIVGVGSHARKTLPRFVEIEGT
jgi:hypothetical protein